MAYVITDECVSCGTCAGECPVEAISEGDDRTNTLSTLIHALTAEHALVFVQQKLSLKANIF